MTTTTPTKGVFGPPIHTYTRAQALADGVLVDAGPLAKEAGFRWPVALTQAAHAEAVAWNPEHEAGQDETGRLWDVLWLATIAARAGRSRFTVARVPNAPGQVEAQDLDLVLHVGPGDTAAPVVTISLPGED